MKEGKFSIAQHITRILCLSIPQSRDPSLPTRDGRILSSWDYVVELIPLQVETTSSPPSNSICNFRIFNQVSDTNPIHPTPIVIDPNHLTHRIHRRPIGFDYKLSDTNVGLPDRISDPSNIYPHRRTLGSRRYIYIITFVFIFPLLIYILSRSSLFLLFRLIMTPDRDLYLGFPYDPLIVPSHPA